MDFLFYIHNAIIINKLRILRNKYFLGIGVRLSKLLGRNPRLRTPTLPTRTLPFTICRPCSVCVFVLVCVCVIYSLPTVFPCVCVSNSPDSRDPCPCPSLTTNA